MRIVSNLLVTLAAGLVPMPFILNNNEAGRLVSPPVVLSAKPGQDTSYPYKNAALPVDQRVKDLLSRMTPEEKFWQLFMIPGSVDASNETKYKNGIFGFQFSAESSDGNTSQQILKYNTSESAVSLLKKINSTQKFFVEKTRLGIPIIAFDEALHGIVREGGTAFPQSIAFAATFDTALVGEVANAIALEAQARGIRQILSPVVNIASDVRWGRVEETYGEDPFLSSEIGVAFVKAFETKNIITTPKHFLANTGDGGRDSYPIHYNERYLEEIHLPPFKALFQRGGARSVMTSYNSIDGAPASANDWLLNEKLKKEWGFKGFVISDAGAVGGANVLHLTTKDYPASGASSVINGLDVIFQTSVDHATLFNPHFLDGSVEQKYIDSAVARVLTAKFELGLFENPYVSEAQAQQILANAKHKAIAKKAALESIVLLKNQDQILPLSGKLKSIALIGTDATEARLGGYSGPGNGKINILDALKRDLPSVKITHSEGPGITAITPAVVPSEYLSHTDAEGKSQKGLAASYFTNISLSGTPATTRNDERVDFKWTFMPPAEGLTTSYYSVKWSGKLKAPATGKYQLGLEGNDGFRLYINDKLIVDRWSKESYRTETKAFDFTAGKQYDIRIEFYQPAGNAAVRLVWNYGVNDNSEALITQAVENAKRSDLAIITAGIHEGEFQDRAFLELPGKQEELIRRVAATGKPVVVLLVGGSAITMSSWIGKVQGIVDIWYPGEEGGNAVADILLGKYNPAGRLPITFPVSVSQVPLVYNHKPTGRGDDYYDLSGEPLFPFGFGLSYTKFGYSGLKFEKSTFQVGDSTKVSCIIKNEGPIEGDEVIQLYIHDELASLARPVLELKGFQRISLKPGESKTVKFNIGNDQLSMLDKSLKPVVEPGTFAVMIGASSKDLRLMGKLEVTPRKDKWSVVKNELIMNNPPFKASHASTLTELKDGTILAAWFGGGYEGNKDVTIRTSLLSNGKWSAPVSVADGIQTKKLRYPCWNPVLLRTHAGKLFLYYKVGPNPREWWGEMKTSDDEGKTWSAAKKLPAGFLGPIKNKSVQLTDGTILHPSSTESLDEKKWIIHLEKSDANSENWKKIEINCDTFGVIQPSLLSYPDGRLQMICRSRQNAIVETWSGDNGNTWSPLAKIDLVNPNSGIDAVTLKSGLQMLVYNPGVSGKEWFNGRNKLRVAVSKDGRKWEDVAILEDKTTGEYSYPAIIEGSDGDVHITYTDDRKNIRYVVLRK